MMEVASDLFDPFAALAEIRGRGAPAEAQKLPQRLPQEVAEVTRQQDQWLRPTSATSATSAGCSDARGLVRARVKTTACKNYIYISDTYDGSEPPSEATPAHAHGHPAEVAEVAELRLSVSEQRETHPDAAAEVLRKQLRKFRAGLAALSPDRPPCPDYRGSEWSAVLTRAHAFLDAFGLRAVALGWTASSLFGVHPEAGIVRTDACGALVLPVCGPATEVTATSIRFGHLTYRLKPGQPEGVPIWLFGRGGRGDHDHD